MLPLDPVCLGRTVERGSGDEEGVTAPSLMSRDENRALESSDCAASIFEERAMRDGIAMVLLAFACVDDRGSRWTQFDT